MMFPDVFSDLRTSAGCNHNDELSSTIEPNLQIQNKTLLNLTPPNQAPMLFYSSTQRNLLAFFRAHRTRQLQLGQIVLDGNYSCTGAHRPDVKHEHFILR